MRISEHGVPHQNDNFKYLVANLASGRELQLPALIGISHGFTRYSIHPLYHRKKKI